MYTTHSAHLAGKISRLSTFITLALVVIVMHLSVTCSCAADYPAKAGASQRLKTIIIENYHPYTFVNEKGEPDGFSVEIAKAVTKAMDLELVIRADKWDVAMKELEAGSIDLLPMMAYSRERDKIFDFSVPHTIAYDAIFTKKGTTGIRALKDLSGKTVIVMNKDIAHSYLLSSGISNNMTLNLVDSLPEALKQLSAGKGDAAIMPKLVGIVTAKKMNILDIETSPQIIDAYTRPFSFAVKEGNQALLERLNQGLNIIKSSGQYDVIYKKWFGALEGSHLGPKTVLRYGTVIVLILLGFMIWNVMLKRKVKGKTEHLEAEIIERKRVEEELKTSEENYRSLTGLTSDYVHRCSRKGTDPFRIQWIGGSIGSISGYSAEEIYKLGCWLPLVHPDDKQDVASYLFSLAPGDFKRKEFRIITKEGKTGWISETSRCEAGNEGELILFGAAKEITERKLAENERDDLTKQLLQAQKLESLGILAGGIAHDFNNILTSIVGNADLALMRMNPESPAIDNLHKIEHAAARAADLAKQMLAYSGKGQFVIKHLDMNLILQEMLHMLEVSISKKAELRLNLTPNLPAVEADATQIQQIIMNLVINASEAIGDMNGSITINTGFMECDKKYLKGFWQDKDIKGGMYVYLEITDTGCGMDKETLDKIFDPFFTTKFTGRGLGMAAVHGIIRGHKGAINVYSEPNKGTSFKVFLPASGKPFEIPNHDSYKDDWKGEGTVLLVDDEEIIRDIGKAMMQELGFSVITANDGQEALDVFKNTPDIAFVILDLTMPHMDGEECFRELRLINPNVRVIMSSGFNEQDVTQKFVGKGLAGFIQKPYKLNVLRDAIRIFLAETRS